MPSVGPEAVRVGNRAPGAGPTGAPASAGGAALAGAGVLVLLVLAAFHGALGNGFVFDDAAYVVGNGPLRHGLTPAALRWSLTSVSEGNWHPLTWISHAVDISVFGLQPRGHHAVNLLLHALNALLLWRVLSGLTGASWKSFLVAALFAVHPLRVESVAWVSERKDVLSAFFGLLSVSAYLSYVRRPAPRRYVAVAALLAAGLAAKPMLVTLPLVLLLLDAWPLGRLGAPRARATSSRPVVEKLPLLALALGSGLLTLAAQSRIGAVKGFSVYAFGDRVANALWSYLAYARMHLPPWDLAVLYPHPGAGAVPWASALAALAAVSVLCVGLVRRAPWMITGWLLYLGMLLPVIGIVQVGDQGRADRYTYLPSVGLFLMFVWGGDAVLARTRLGRQAGAASVMAATLALAAVTSGQVRHWKSDETLFRRALAVAQDNWFAEFNLGNALLARGEAAEAAGHFSAAVRIRPDFAKAHNNLGTALLSLGRRAEAVAAYREAVRCDPLLAEARSNLGRLLAGQGEIDDAVEHLERAVQLDPSYAPDHLALGRALALRKRDAEALRHFREAGRLDPALRAEAQAGERLLQGP